jgi:ketopantoate reductase
VLLRTVRTIDECDLLKEKPKVLIVGAGAIGLSVAGWIFSHNENLNLLARGESVAAIRRHGLRLYKIGQEAATAPIPVKVIESLDEIPPPDIIIITVKNYDLDRTAQTLRYQLGNCQPIVASLQNGVENQQILPKYFSRAIYGVVLLSCVQGSFLTRLIVFGILLTTQNKAKNKQLTFFSFLAFPRIKKISQ